MHQLNFENNQQVSKQPPLVANFRNQQTTPSSKDIDQTIQLNFPSNFPIKSFSRYKIVPRVSPRISELRVT